MDERRRPAARHRLRRPIVVGAGVMATLALAGCGGSGDDQQAVPEFSTTAATPDDVIPTTEYPVHALLLRDTIPMSYQHRTLTAFNIRTSKGNLDIVGENGQTIPLVVVKGATFAADGIQFRVVDVVPNENKTGAPGGSTGRIVLLPLD